MVPVLRVPRTPRISGTYPVRPELRRLLIVRWYFVSYGSGRAQL